MRPGSCLSGRSAREQWPPGPCIVTGVRCQEQQPADHGEGEKPPRDPAADDRRGQREDEQQGNAGEGGQPQRHADRVDGERDQADAADGQQQERVGGGHGSEGCLGLDECEPREVLQLAQGDRAGEDAERCRGLSEHEREQREQGEELKDRLQGRGQRHRPREGTRDGHEHDGERGGHDPAPRVEERHDAERGRHRGDGRGDRRGGTDADERRGHRVTGFIAAP